MQNSTQPEKASVAGRLRASRLAAGLTQEEAAAYLRSRGQKVSRRTLAAWESRSDDRVPEDAQGAAVLVLLREAAGETAARAAVPSGGLVRLADSDRTLVAVPELSVEAGCGNEVEAPSDEEQWVGRVYLPAAYIRHEYGVDPADVFVLRGRGTSMMPTILPGQRVVVARFHAGMRLRDGLVYALSTEYGAMLKRLFFEPGGVYVKSDNPEAPSYRVPWPDFEAGYRVVAYALEVGTRL